MISNLFLIMMIAHLIGDFYLQSDKIAEKKKSEFVHLLLHFLLYSFIGALFFAFIIKSQIIWYYAFFILCHMVIDLVKFSLPAKIKEKPWVYITDQLLHIISIITIAIVFENTGKEIHLLGFAEKAMSSIPFETTEILKVILLILLILKPVNISFKKIFIKDESGDKSLEINENMNLEEKTKEVNLGATIGSMERLLIVILLLLGQYTAIGLVLTGKSVARYNKVNAEYYIVGTFFSLLAALIPYLIIMELM